MGDCLTTASAYQPHGQGETIMRNKNVALTSQNWLSSQKNLLNHNPVMDVLWNEGNHNRAVRYPCDICGKDFSRKFSLKIHQRDSHFTTIDMVFQCNHCGRTAATQKALEMHVHRYHSLKQTEILKR